MFPSNTDGLYCPGCQPGDFAQPHICGINRAISSGYCYLCNQAWEGSHVCLKAWQDVVPTTTALTTSAPAIASSCDHCFCLKQKAGWHDVPEPSKPTFGGQLGASTVRRHLKPHVVCCNCGGRRLRTEADR